MTEPQSPVLRDLSKLAVDRCRKAFMTVGQLVEDDIQRSAMLATVALEMLRGAASLMAHARDISETKALIIIYNQVAEVIQENVNGTEKDDAHKRPARRSAAGGRPKGDG